jgi:hypothetical protein
VAGAAAHIRSGSGRDGPSAHAGGPRGVVRHCQRVVVGIRADAVDECGPGDDGKPLRSDVGIDLDPDRAAGQRQRGLRFLRGE